MASMIEILKSIRHKGHFKRKDLEFLERAIEVEMLMRDEDTLEEFNESSKGLEIKWENDMERKPSKMEINNRKSKKHFPLGRRKWSENDMNLLRKYWYIEQKDPKEIAKILGRTEWAIKTRIRVLDGKRNY